MVFSKIFEHVKKDWKFLLVHFMLLAVVLLIATTSFYYSDYTLQLPPNNLFANITYIVSILMGIIFYFVIKIFENKNLKLEYLYLCLAIPLGIMFCIANPLGKIPDEDQHARKSMAISNGIFFAHRDEEGNPSDKFNAKLIETVTRNVTSYKESFRKVMLDETDEEIELVYSMATYSPICHIPQAFGMFITRIFGSNKVNSI